MFRNIWRSRGYVAQRTWNFALLFALFTPHFLASCIFTIEFKFLTTFESKGLRMNGFHHLTQITGFLRIYHSTLIQINHILFSSTRIKISENILHYQDYYHITSNLLSSSHPHPYPFTPYNSSHNSSSVTPKFNCHTLLSTIHLNGKLWAERKSFERSVETVLDKNVVLSFLHETLECLQPPLPVTVNTDLETQQLKKWELRGYGELSSGPILYLRSWYIFEDISSNNIIGKFLKRKLELFQ